MFSIQRKPMASAPAPKDYQAIDAAFRRQLFIRGIGCTLGIAGCVLSLTFLDFLAPMAFCLAIALLLTND